MKLRLKSLALMVPNVKRVIDVGCDHALLDICLAMKYLNTKFLAIDISEKALMIAKKNIHDASLESRIKVLKNDGLKGIELNDDDFIIITGLGTNTIIKIIEEKKDFINNILIQSNRDIESLRKYMCLNGFKIKDEKVIVDSNFYVFIHFEKGNESYDSIDFWLGPIIKKGENTAYFEFLLKKYKKILPGIPDNDLKKSEIIKRIDFLSKLLKESRTTTI